MSLVVGIDVGAYKHAAAICRSGEPKADKRVFRYAATQPGFKELDLWLERQGLAIRRRLGTLADTMRPGGRRRLGETKAGRIQELAKQTIAPPEMDEQMAFEVGLLIQQCDLLAKQIEPAETRVGELLDSELALRLQTIPGVGVATAASLIAEVGGKWRFDDFDQLAAYAGTHPKEQSSGRHREKAETSWRMAKTGNFYLRSALYRMAVVGIQHNPIIKEHYRRKRIQGKAPMNAIGHCMAKLRAIVWGAWLPGQSFDPNKGGRNS